MDKIRIRGGRPLRGSLAVGGAKNAALPLMTASLLTDETLTLAQVPHLADIATLANLLAQHGVVFGMDGSAPQDGAAGRVLQLTAREITSTTAPYDLVRKMRASVLVLGPLVARCGVAKVSLPGGCAIGARPVDLHIKGLVQMGAQIELEAGYILASAPNGLHGAQIVFPTVSVGATENLLMAACLAKGETVLVNAAREPEVTDLARCLIAMGAQIEGLGTRHAAHPGQGPAARRLSHRRPRPDRNRHLRHGRRHHRRRSGTDQRQAGAYPGRHQGAEPAPASRSPRPNAASACRAPTAP